MSKNEKYANKHNFGSSKKKFNRRKKVGSKNNYDLLSTFCYAVALATLVAGLRFRS